MEEFGLNRKCEVCGKGHRSLLQARMCCDVLAPPDESMADKMVRLNGIRILTMKADTPASPASGGGKEL